MLEGVGAEGAKRLREAGAPQTEVEEEAGGGGGISLSTHPRAPPLHPTPRAQRFNSPSPGASETYKPSGDGEELQPDPPPARHPACCPPPRPSPR